MPVPDLSGVPPWAEFNDLKNKINDIVAKYNNLLVNLDSLNVVSITADHIDAGTIDANVVTIRSDLAAGAFVQIDGNGMRINNGTYDTFTADINGFVTMTGAMIRNDLTTGFIELSNAGMRINNGTYDTFTANINGYVTMTGALIQSKTGYPMVIMDPDNELFGAYKDPNNSIAIEADYGGAPSHVYTSQGVTKARFSTLLGTLLIDAIDGMEINVTNNGNLVLPAFTRIVGNGRNLGAELDEKAVAGISTNPSGGHNHGIPDGTVLQTAGGGTVTFRAAGTHTHQQTN